MGWLELWATVTHKFPDSEAWWHATASTDWSAFLQHLMTAYQSDEEIFNEF